jgi:ribonucleoside-diphosphate reductase beta chain
MAHMLAKTSSRFVLFPIKKKYLYDYYLKHVQSFWTVHEIPLAEDKASFEGLSKDTRNFLLAVLGFFAASDGIVIENLIGNFAAEVTMPEARAFYSVQNFMENIHSETYSILIDTYAPDNASKEKLFTAIETHQSTKDKADWVISKMVKDKTIDPVLCFTKRLIAFACCEGIMFSSSFCAIFYLKNMGDAQLTGLFMTNELISRDEGLHTEFACSMYNNEFPHLDDECVHNIVREACNLEKAFVRDILKNPLVGMNSKIMCEYVEYVADFLLKMLNHPVLYNAKLPEAFNFMHNISLSGKTNFFERAVSDYSIQTDDTEFTLDSSDF